MERYKKAVEEHLKEFIEYTKEIETRGYLSLHVSSP
jgi:hypothetical protein